VTLRRVLMVCLTDDPLDPPGEERIGGGHFFVFDLGRYLVRLGWKVHYVTRRNAPDKPTREHLGPLCQITRVDAGPQLDLHPLALAEHLEPLVRAVAAVDGLLESDVVHSHGWLSGAVARRMLGFPGPRHVHSILSLGRVRLELGEDSSPADSFRDALELDLLGSADVLIAAAASEREDFNRLYPEIAHDRIVVIPYGVDPDVFYPRPEPADSFVRRQARRFAEGPD